MGNVGPDLPTLPDNNAMLPTSDQSGMESTVGGETRLSEDNSPAR
ncbi:MAG: hypothetical protein QGI31_02845 [Dehalococcoidia bacterium]|nr:hypothetical protein [Dehalococcoidia bacterium]